MRHYARFTLPRGIKSQLLSQLASRESAGRIGHESWRQILLTELLGEEASHKTLAALLARISPVVGQAYDAKHFSGVLHWGSGEEVPRHADNLARTCFLIPLRCTKTLEFFEGYDQCALEGKRLVRFNDYEDHGLRNPYRGHFYLLTLSRDRV